MTRIAIFLLYALLSAGWTNLVFQQTETTSNEPYRTVPADYREPLRLLINRIIELEKQRQWQKLYDLMSPSYRTDSRDEFVRSHSRTSRLIEFNVDQVIESHTDKSNWITFGCAVFERDGKKNGWRSAIYANLSNSQWLASTVLVNGGEGSGYSPCKND
jgi:hypothetical protein